MGVAGWNPKPFFAGGLQTLDSKLLHPVEKDKKVSTRGLKINFEHII